MSVLIRDATIVTMDADREIVSGDILIQADRIAAIGQVAPEQVEPGVEVVDGRGRLVIPGLIQAHVHLCQTLFRGRADDLELLDWLKKRIWPLEGAHDEESIYCSALLGAAELFRGGTTAVIDMETVHHTDAAIQAIHDCGLRALTGKVMMDAGDDVPPTLRESTEQSLRESVDLLEKWHNAAGGRIKYAFAPRFLLSCSKDLLREVAALSGRYDVKVHSHAAENRAEVAAVLEECGTTGLVYLEGLGLANPNLVLAHCIWLDDEEKQIIAQSGLHVAHCPSSNLKLASGIAKIPELHAMGANIAIGADGAPCNNNLDMFVEMRTAALIQKPFYGPTSMPAPLVFEMATIGGARAMGLEDEAGSLEVSKKADLAMLDLQHPHTEPTDGVDVYSQLVYQAKSSDVVMTMIDGKIVMRDGRLTTINEEEILQKARAAIRRVASRAGHP